MLDALNGALLDEAYIRTAINSGVHTIHVTINNFGSISPYPDLKNSLLALARLRQRIDSLDNAYLVCGAGDLTPRPGQLGVILGYQNMPGVGRDIELLALFRQMEVLVIQISHNSRNEYADGCSEDTNAGLSALGRKAVTLLNELHIAIDLSHTGDASSVEVLQQSVQPCAITHANAYAIAQNVRNKSDSVLDALAKNGGVIGICYLPPIVHTQRQPATVDDVIRHIDHIAQRIGPQHIGIGSDFIDGQPSERYAEFMRQPEVYGVWPWRFAVADLDAQNRLFDELLRRGYSDSDVKGIAGDNFRNLFAKIWSGKQKDD